MSKFFDYERVAAEAGISPADLDALRRRVQADYANDEMMCELRLLRTCHAIAAGKCTVADALKSEERVPTPARSSPLR